MWFAHYLMCIGFENKNKYCICTIARRFFFCEMNRPHLNEGCLGIGTVHSPIPPVPQSSERNATERRRMTFSMCMRHTHPAHFASSGTWVPWRLPVNSVSIPKCCRFLLCHLSPCFLSILWPFASHHRVSNIRVCSCPERKKCCKSNQASNGNDLIEWTESTIRNVCHHRGPTCSTAGSMRDVWHAVRFLLNGMTVINASTPRVTASVCAAPSAQSLKSIGNEYCIMLIGIIPFSRILNTRVKGLIWCRSCLAFN